MARNIVLLFDGTSNQICANRTNILRLYGSLTKSDTQVVWYDPGVGTFGSENSWLEWPQKVSEVWGMATGWGMDTNVKEAYRFLVETVDPHAAEPDRICIFGFSRGAYTARVLAGFLHAFGLMEKRNLNLLDYAYRAYKRIGDDGDENAFAEIRLFERIIRPERPTIHLLGLFDTVASVIESGRFTPRLRNHAHVVNNVSVRAVRHAVAINERRTMFRPLLWGPGQRFKGNRFDPTDGDPQDMSEVWFRGVHGDIGGGYPEEQSALAKLPLDWMIEETRPLGILYKTRTVNEIVLGQGEDDKYVAPDPKGPQHESLKKGWKLVEYLPRRKTPGSTRKDFHGWILPKGEMRTIPPGAVIHPSVPEGGALPPNVPTDHTLFQSSATQSA